MTLRGTGKAASAASDTNLPSLVPCST